MQRPRALSAMAPFELKRVLRAPDAAWLVAGNMFGAGIFITPGLVAGHLPGVAWSLVAWVLGGVLALFGASTYAELGVRIPHAGGDYQYLASAFGPRWAFLFGWSAITLSFSAAAAVMARVATAYVSAAIGLDAQAYPLVMYLLPPIAVLVLSLVNTAGARVGGRTTAVLTALPVLGLVVIAGVGAGRGGVDFQQSLGWFSGPGRAWPLAFGAAMVPIFFTYSGWNAAAYLAGELKDPERSLARALLAGAASVTIVYLVVNLTLLLVLPREQLAGSTTAVADAARLMIGHRAEAVLAAIIGVAVLGSANVTLMAGARIYYAMGRDGLAPAALARVNSAGVPHAALWSGGIWTAVLALVGDVEKLVNWATLAILLLSSLTVASLFVLRRRDPRGAFRDGFRCPGYPFVPAIYMLVSLAVALASGIDDPVHSLIGVGIVALGLPVHALVRHTFRSGGAGGIDTA